jgi:hypothetical protein
MTKTITISLSLGSGAPAEELAAKIRLAAQGKPISEFIRNIIIEHLGKSANGYALDVTDSL